MAGADVLVMLISVGQTRFLAEVIGPEGFGVYALLLSFFRVFAALGSTWMSVSAARWIAHHVGEGDMHRAGQVFFAGVLISGLITLSGAAVFGVFHLFFMQRFITRDIVALYFLLFVGVMVVTSYRTVLTAVLQGLQAMGLISFTRAAAAIVQVIAVVALAIPYGIAGFFTGLLIGGAFAATVSIWGLWRRSDLRPVNVTLWSPNIRPFLAFGGVDLALLVVFSAGEFVQRRVVLDELGITQVGFMFAAISIVINMGILNRAVFFYLLPKMAGETSAARQTDFSLHMRFTLYSAIPIAITAMLFSRTGIALLLGDAFADLETDFYLFALLFLFMSVQSPAAGLILSLAKLRVHAFATVANVAAALTVMILLIDPMGFAAIGIGLIAGQAISYSIRLFYIVAFTEFVVDMRAMLLHGFAAASFIVSYLIIDASVWLRILTLTLVIIALLASLRGQERDEISRS